MTKRNVNRIAYVNPKRSLWSKNPKIFKSLDSKKEFLRPWYCLPLGLITLAGLISREIQADLFDEDFHEIDFSPDYDLVAISAMTQQAFRAYEIADNFRRIGVPVVMGGIHATVLPDEASQHVDAVVIGEGEQLWPQCLEDLENGGLKSVYNNPPDSFFDLSEAPIPRFDLVPPDIISKDSNFFNMLPVHTTRGCPHDCEFCLVSKVHGRRIRKKNIAHIVKEIGQIKEHLGNHLMVFADDNLFVDRKFAKDLLKAILPLNIRWMAQSDIGVAKDEDLLRLAYASGCSLLLIGFESLNETNLRHIAPNHWKARQLKGYSEAVNRIQENGIAVHASFVVGFDDDDVTVFEDIHDFMITNHCAGQFTILTPLPGTRLYKKLESEGRLFEKRFWDKCNFFDVTFEPKKMSVDELVSGFIWLYDEVFNREAFSKRAEYMKRVYRKLS